MEEGLNRVWSLRLNRVPRKTDFFLTYVIMKTVQFILLKAERGLNTPGVYALMETVEVEESQNLDDVMNGIIGKNLGQNLYEAVNFDENEEIKIFPAKNYQELVEKIEVTFVFNKPYEIIYVNENGNLVRHVANIESVMKYAEQEYEFNKYMCICSMFQ